MGKCTTKQTSGNTTTIMALQSTTTMVVGGELQTPLGEQLQQTMRNVVDV
jgi:hypothetical protein